ncbi:MAG: ATP-dependent zinc metalloprotease FtsH [Acidobacteria bacterium]|nr:MAG: ATP-dependent zinc metalloprotease FtsH [Acidobacteriota bacterium]REK03079.1 MAG: ATP-dependent zinc metalloprotease FtsH [Acidobacteriota bacterium]REK15427.1 MAG: ATP-dependent zinc metalloprotease FtsH [Acidobacteriota bacterium]REK45778.1 MAG: ATP-dependent zinc metalloprotease FtsH [Acidobacteriota bacterium]
MIISSALLFVWFLQSKQGKNPQDLTIDAAITRINNKDFKEAYFKASQVEFTDANGDKYVTTIGSDPMRELLINKIEAHNEANASSKIERKEDPPSSGWGWLVLIQILPFLLLVGFLAFTLRQMQAGGNKALSFGKSKAKLLNNQQKRVTFKDVAGVQEAKEELQEIIEFLKDPQKFQKLGGKIPKGVLMVGPPGTGKTLLAKAVAGEANVPFFSISGSDFVEMFVGVGASRVRDLFEQGKKNAPCIIFIDEIDAVGRHRGAGLGGGHDEREQTLNQLLVEMDGFESNDGVILMASTNRPDVLDPALLRPGRFDRRVVVGRPDVKGREGILKVHTRKIPLDENVDISIIARGTPGFTGADLANLVNEAALNAARFDKKVVTMSDFELSKDKVLMGAERKSMVISDDEKKLTAYHEAGHTLVGLKVPSADPVHKVTIIPRGMALGVTQQLPEGDKHSLTKEYLTSQIAILMGGRIAEEIFFGDSNVTTGASNDIERATDLARSMVCEYGMSSLGPLTFGKKDEQIFLGREINQHRDYSEDTAIKIDQEVNKIVADGYEKARQVITDNHDAMVRLSEALLERETLDGVQIRRVVAGLPLDGDEESEGSDDDGSEEKSKSPFKKPILPPITGNNPATA